MPHIKPFPCIEQVATVAPAPLARLITDYPKEGELGDLYAAVGTMGHSWQRPSAITNATMSEFRTARKITDDDTGKTCWVMTVARHKTAREGPAHITMSEVDYRLACRYIKYIRPVCNPTAENLFVGTNGNPISQPNKNIQWLGERYGIGTPTCTDLRQTGGTEAGQRCDEPTRRLISHQMSHSDAVHFKHYEKLGGQKKAAKAFGIRQRLTYGSSNSEESQPLQKQQKGKGKVVSQEKQQSQPQKPKDRKARVEYTAKELKTIKEYFSGHIKDCRSASKGECEQFLTLNPMNRNKKQIQDKVRQLYLSSFFDLS